MFRWLDLLEKEFDKTFVDLDILLGEIDPDQSEITYDGRQKNDSAVFYLRSACSQSADNFSRKCKIGGELED